MFMKEEIPDYFEFILHLVGEDIFSKSGTNPRMEMEINF